MSAFAGIKVLDLSRVLAGPYSGQLLADMGADVIKIEEPSGDELRQWFPRAENGSTNFMAVNRGKRALVLDLKKEEGRALLMRLVKEADVLIHSFLTPVAERLGVTYDAVKAANPDLIYCSISGYGTTGEMKDRPGYDLMMQAFTGVMMLTGEPNGPPMRAGLSTIDLSTGFLAFGAISAALFARATGKARGQRIDLSLMHTGIALLGYHVTNYMNAGHVAARAGSGVGHIVPYQAWKCSDGWVLAGATNDKFWARFATALGLEHLIDDTRFQTTVDRRNNREELIPLLEARFATDTVEQWVTVMESAQVPVSPVHTIDQVVTHPQVLANGMIASVPDRHGEPMHVIGLPVLFSETPGRVTGRPPELGEHSDVVLRDWLGLSPAEVELLRDVGVI
jgi:crotonobetainyl-CoA:carnitine CoA-transferase CaiB-like acyl-CoA transferase